MITTIIIDDELWVCRLIKSIVNWEELNFRLIGEAFNGNQAFELIKEKKPELVITDIRMPGMDGISLIKNVKELGLDTNFIIVSGYNDFEYAREALKYGALGYLLKPIDKKELTALLNKVRENIFKTKEKIFEENLVKGKLEHSLNQLKEQFFLNLLQFGILNQEKPDIGKVNQDYEAKLKHGNFQVLVYKLDFKNRQEQVANVENEVLNSMQEIVYSQFEHNCYDITVIKLRNQLICILNYNSYKDFIIKNAIKTSFDIMNSTIHLLEDFYLTIGVGSCETDFGSLPNSFNLAQNAIKARAVLNVGKIIDISGNVYSSDDMKRLFSLETEIKLAGFLEVFDIKSLEAAVTGIFHTFTERKDINPSLVLEVANEITEVFFKVMRRIDIGIETEYIAKSKVYKDIEECISINDLINYFTNLFDGARNFYNNSKHGQNRKAIEMVKVYVRDHFKEDIGLDDVAKLVFLSPKYLSELFKKETGINFSDYLINYRIDVAKELLKDVRYKANEVAELVGYYDAKHFSKLFKKIVGVNPTEYRKMFG